MSIPRGRRVAAWSAMALALTSCGGGSPVSDFCLIYEPVYVAETDSEETIRQAMRNNAAWEALCAGNPDPPGD